MENYQIIGHIGEGAHGLVLQGKHIMVCYFNILIFFIKIKFN